MLNEGKTAEEIKAVLNTEEKVNVLVTPGLFEVGQHELPVGMAIKEGVSKVYPSNDSFVVVNVKTIMAPSEKSLEDVKGKVLNNYQNDIEARWIKELRSKYKVEVDKKTLKHLKKELK